MSNSFIEKCINGDASLDEIDDYIDEWHDRAVLQAVASGDAKFITAVLRTWRAAPRAGLHWCS